MSDQEKVETGPKRKIEGWDVIVRHYEQCLKLHSSTPRGVDWPNGSDLAARFGVMLELLAGTSGRPVLLDLGCGPGLLVDYLTAAGGANKVQYKGIDRSQVMIEAACARWPKHEFTCQDILASPLPEKCVDFVVMNGVLNERVSLGVEEMTTLAKSLVVAAFRVARIGIAFNVMNTHVDWEREDLFYWPFDTLADFLKREVSRHYSFRADYGLYEYTCFVRREPRRAPAPSAEGWWAA